MFLSIKNVPKVSWSSKKPFNFKPKFSFSKLVEDMIEHDLILAENELI